MAYPEGHNDTVRKRILREARRAFNSKGYDGVTIDEVMKAAELTRGAFYFHFRSKAELYREAIAFILDDHPVKRWASKTPNRLPAEQLLSAYLSEQHLEEVEESCPLITHAAEAARHDPDAKSVVTRVFRALVDTLSNDIDDKGGDAGLVIAAMCVGGLSVARGVDDPQLAGRLLKATRSAARKLAGWKDRDEQPLTTRAKRSTSSVRGSRHKARRA